MKRLTWRIALFIGGIIILAAAGMWIARPGINIIMNTDTSRPVSVAEQSTESDDVSAEAAYVRRSPGVPEEMQYAEYWKTGSGDELFTSSEIRAFNDNNPAYVEYYSVSEGRRHKLFIDDLPDSITGEALRDLINQSGVCQFADGTRSVYINGELPDDGYWQAVIENLAEDRIADTVSPDYAICVARTDVRLIPVNDFAAEEPDEIYCDSFTAAEVMPFAGVAVLHESADHEWYFIINGSFCGWVRADSLAICSDREEWKAARNPEEFLVVTGREVRLDENAVPSKTSGMMLPMGVKLRLLEDAPEYINGRSTWGCYCAELPVRDGDGGLEWEQALIPVSEDVHAGYLKMTSDSVVEQAFKFLGHVYGYGGSLSSNDCSGIVRQIYGCYGFELPRNARAIAKLTDLGSFDCSKMTSSKKKQILSDMPAGLLLFMDGHIMIYLGMAEDTPYVISSCATCIEPGHDLSDIRNAYCVFVSGMDLLRSNGNTWLEDISYILWKEH